MDPKAVFDHHWNSFGAGDLDEVLADYAEESIVVRPNCVARGPAEIRQAFAGIFANFEGFKGSQESVTVGGSMVLLEWTARATDGRVVHGNDSFYIERGKILYQTYVGAL